jgi:hypothetical protein
VEKYVRKYGDAALIAELTKTVNTHGEAKALFSAEVADSLAQIVEAAERCIERVDYSRKAGGQGVRVQRARATWRSGWRQWFGNPKWL